MIDWQVFMSELRDLCLKHGVTSVWGCSCCEGVNIYGDDDSVSNVRFEAEDDDDQPLMKWQTFDPFTVHELPPPNLKAG